MICEWGRWKRMCELVKTNGMESFVCESLFPSLNYSHLHSFSPILTIEKNASKARCHKNVKNVNKTPFRRWIDELIERTLLTGIRLSKHSKWSMQQTGEKLKAKRKYARVKKKIEKSEKIPDFSEMLNKQSENWSITTGRNQTRSLLIGK